MVPRSAGGVRPGRRAHLGNQGPHSLDAARAAYSARLGDSTAASIQGLVSICGCYHYAEKAPERAMRIPSFGDFARRTSLERERCRFVEMSEAECVCLRIVKHVIGRAEWGKACVQQMNPGTSYHHCNETLRDELHAGAWDARRSSAAVLGGLCRRFRAAHWFRVWVVAGWSRRYDEMVDTFLFHVAALWRTGAARQAQASQKEFLLDMGSFARSLSR